MTPTQLLALVACKVRLHLISPRAARGAKLRSAIHRGCVKTAKYRNLGGGFGSGEWHASSRMRIGTSARRFLNTWATTSPKNPGSGGQRLRGRADFDDSKAQVALRGDGGKNLAARSKPTARRQSKGCAGCRLRTGPIQQGHDRGHFVFPASRNPLNSRRLVERCFSGNPLKALISHQLPKLLVRVRFPLPAPTDASRRRRATRATIDASKTSAPPLAPKTPVTNLCQVGVDDRDQLLGGLNPGV